MRRMRATDRGVLRGILGTVTLGTLAMAVVAATLARQAARSADALGRGLAHPMLAAPAGGGTPATPPPAAPAASAPEEMPGRGPAVRSRVADSASGGGGANGAVGTTTVTGAPLGAGATGGMDATAGDTDGAR